MARDLIITNGKSAGGSIRATGIADEYLIWGEALYVGPVPLTPDLPSLSRIRAEYWDERKPGGREEVFDSFVERDSSLLNAGVFDRVVIWAGHEIIEQLALIQILDYFAENSMDDNELYLLQADDCLGIQNREQIFQLQGTEKKVTQAQLELARKAWTSFRQPTPEAFVGLLSEILSALPNLKPTIKRILQELPSANGITRIQKQILFMLDKKPMQPASCCGRTLILDDFNFLGDLIFFEIFWNLAKCQAPLIFTEDKLPVGAWPFQEKEVRNDFYGAQFQLTDLGRAVLNGEEDFAKFNDFHFWWGGTEITKDNLWRWDDIEGRLSCS